MSQDNQPPPETHTDEKSSLNLKGKGKDTNTNNEESSTVTGRLQASGRLALNAFGTGPGLSGQQPTAKASTSGSNNISRIVSSSGEASSHKLHSSVQGETLRSKANLDSGVSAQAFDAFVSADSTLDHYDDKPTPNDYRSTYVSMSQDVSDQEKRDGAAVINLLDGPSDELDAVLLGVQEDDETLTPEAAAKLREALFPTNSTSSGPGLNDLLNFNPDFLNQPGAEAELERQLHLGTRDTDEARNNWLQQWGNVLNGYTDYVWGDLEPLIAEARKEVEETKARGSNEASETKALERLRQILAHVRGF